MIPPSGNIINFSLRAVTGEAILTHEQAGRINGTEMPIQRDQPKNQVFICVISISVSLILMNVSLEAGSLTCF